MKTKKMIVAGALVREVIYSRAAGREPAAVRQAKRKTSTEAQQRLNARLSWEKLELMLAANFVPGDLVATLTFDDDHLPPDRKTAAARLKKFRGELARIRAEKSEELRMIWTLENKLGTGRWHVHAVINTTGGDFGDILRCWPYGSEVRIEKLELNKSRNYETLARYMCKEARERPGLRCWSTTRSCRKPEVEVWQVPDDERIEIPAGATVIQEETKRTEWAEFAYAKYLMASAADLRRTRPRAKRRR